MDADPFYVVWRKALALHHVERGFRGTMHVAAGGDDLEIDVAHGEVLAEILNDPVELHRWS